VSLSGHRNRHNRDEAAVTLIKVLQNGVEVMSVLQSLLLLALTGTSNSSTTPTTAAAPE
jgi:hypothetical protein